MPSEDAPYVTTVSADGITAVVVAVDEFQNRSLTHPGEVLTIHDEELGTVSTAPVRTPSGDLLFLLRGATERPCGEYHPLPCGLDKACGFGAGADATD